MAVESKSNSLACPTHQNPRIGNINDFGALSNRLPIGGTTGLCHASSSVIDEAAIWYAANRETCERPIIPALRHRFGLTALQAIAALREAARA